MVEHITIEDGWVAAAPPPGEQERLRALRGFGILDTAPTAEFDNITRLVSDQLGTAFALVSLVDKDRQWFKSACGIDAQETPRDMAFCAHAIWETLPLIVPDATADERFRNNPLVAGEPHIRFYAGIPLITATGHCLGTLCAIDTHPRPNGLSEKEISLLQGLAKMVMDELTLHVKNRELTQAIEYKSHFLSTMSHEIRTPLNGVLGMTQLLESSDLNEKQRHYTNVIMSSGNSLLAIVNDILDLAKLEAGKININFDQYPLRSLIGDVLALYEPIAERDNTHLFATYEDSAPQFFYSDPGRLKQVLNNLVDNALKFSKGKSVSVVVKSREDKLRFEIRDTGIGIAEENLPYMFDRFVQEDLGSARRYEGTGLGLAIVKEIAELLYGNVGVDSVKGEGSVFWVEIPLRSEIAPSSTNDSIPDVNEINAQEHNFTKVLVVEDNEINRMVAREMLEQANCIVIEACSGQEGIDIYQQEQPDIVLMDISMPGMDGKTATKQILTTNHWKQLKTPIIALTAHVLPEDQESYKAAGMHGFIAKPMQQKDLETIMQEHLVQS